MKGLRIVLPKNPDLNNPFAGAKIKEVKISKRFIQKMKRAVKQAEEDFESYQNVSEEVMNTSFNI
jgi:hypothetical protein